MERPKNYMENPYIGPQGETCHTLEVLRAAEADYKRNFLTFIGPQGETCRTHEALDAARAEYNRRFNQPIDIPVVNLKIDLTQIKVMDDLK
jgi:hypothetical protein